MFLISFASVGTVIYTPALPAIAEHFQVTIGQAQNTITYFLFGYAFGQLPYGPLLNYLGRKPTIYLGCAVAFAGTILCILSNYVDLFWLLNLGRLVMALGMAVGLVSTFTIIADTMNRKEAHKTISYTTLAFALFPGLSVVIGGFLTEYVGWVSCFYLVAAYCILLMFMAARLPKTGPEPFTHSIHPVNVSKGYWAQAATPHVLMGAIILGATTAAVSVFRAKGPFLGVTLIGISPADYGLWMLVPTLGTLGGSLLSAYFSARRGPRPLVWFGMAVMGLSIAAALVAFALGRLSVWSLFLPITFIYLGRVICYTAISSSIMAAATDKSNASAFMNFLAMGIAGVSVFIAGVEWTKSALFLPILQMIFVIIAVACFILYIWMHRRTHRKRERLDEA